jgi:hypothetical protein
MFDNEGRFTYSSIVKIGSAKNGNSLSVYPNPVSDLLNVTASVEKTEMVFFKIIDSYGRTVASTQILLQKGSNAFSWDIATLGAGNYFMVSTGQGHTVLKFIKN